MQPEKPKKKSKFHLCPSCGTETTLFICPCKKYGYNTPGDSKKRKGSAKTV